MEINDQNIAALGQYLQQTLNPSADERKKAEAFLKQCEKETGYSLLLLTCMDKNNVDLTIRTAASITFKNVVKRCWESDENISPQDRKQVKQHIVKVNIYRF
jgi:exportin-2 (importin alpha re-exporter)